MKPDARASSSRRTTQLAFLSGGGEMGSLMRAYDWSRSPLGDPADWPQSLKSVVSACINSPIMGAVLWGPKFLLLYNDAYRVSLADRHPSALGRPVSEVWGDAWTQVSAPFYDCLATGEGFEKRGVELKIVRNGRPETTYWNFSASPVYGEDGSILGLLNQGVETTVQVVQDRARTIEVERQRLLLQKMPGFIAVLSGPQHVFEYVNDAYMTIAGPRAFVGRNVREVFPELHGQGFFELLDRVYKSGDAFSAKTMPVQLNGEDQPRHIDFLFQPIRDDDGSIIGIFVGGYDITERLRVVTYRDALVRMTDRIGTGHDPAAIGYAAAEIIGETLKVSRVGYGTIDPEAETLHVERDWNAPGVETLAGVVPLRNYGSLVESLKSGEFISIDDVDRDPRTAEAAGALKSGSASSFVKVPMMEYGRIAAMLYVNHDAVRAWTSDELTFIKEAAARIRSAVERSRIEAALRELNATLEERIEAASSALRLYENIVQSDAAPICAFDTQYRLIAFNKAHNDEFRRVNGFDTKLGDVFPDLFIQEQRNVMRTLMSRALSGERFTVTEEFGRPEYGQPAWEITYTPLHDEGGAIIGAFHVAEDISDRLRAEDDLAIAQEALRQSQKMEAMGQLTGGVAHDFNNLLTPIVGSLDMLQRRGIGTAREQRLIAGAAQSAERAKTLVQRLLAFARRQPLQPVPVNIAKLVSGMGDLVSSTTGPHIRVTVDAPIDLPPAKADPNQLEMAILNLAVNARDAMPEGGILRISASQESIHAGHRSKLRPGQYIRLSVADSGVGMNEATLARAIEPFFSTKGIGKGTGLGLSMVHGLASQLGGAICIASRPGDGTNVELWLPQSDDGVTIADAAHEPSLPAVIGKALLVDDEELVRISTADMLNDLGYVVVEAASGEEAMRLVERGEQFDLLVTDHLMPGMNGTDLAHAVRLLKPRVPVLLVSGYAEHEGLDLSFPRLAKPFRKDELTTSLAHLSGD